MMLRSLDEFSRDALAMLAREYLMAGHLIDRAGMPHVMAELGGDAFGPVAIEEWMGASPIYTKRMQRALQFEGHTVETIFKGMQFDIGAPPQFLDFRFTLHDDDHGEFWLDHCGALADCEPMGPDIVFTMCHDIEDPTFDATAIATNARAQVRPIHRPPRVPADRSPVCHWTVEISDDHEPLPVPAQAAHMATTLAAGIALSPIDPRDAGRADYRGPLLADVRFEDFSRSALRRICEEICLQGHLLSLSFLAALERRMDRDGARLIARRQFTGVAGVVAGRLRDALGLGHDLPDVAQVLAVHPALNPAQYVQPELDPSDGVRMRFVADSPAMADGGWLSLLDADHLDPVDAIVRAIDPRYRCEPLDDGEALAFEVVLGDAPARESGDVGLTRISTGAAFAFGDRGTPVELRPTASR